MCDHNSNHEFWVTPAKSKHLTSKTVLLHPGKGMAIHTTGLDREEVITCLSGRVDVTVYREGLAYEPEVVSLYQAESEWIGEETYHSVVNNTDEDAVYIFVVTKTAVCPATK